MFAVEVWFDDKTNRLVENVWEAAGGPPFGYADTRPHCSFSVVDSLRPKSLAGQVAALPWHQMRTLRFGDISEFADPDVLYASVVQTRRMRKLHQRLDNALVSTGAEIRSYYRPGNWTPHCTLAMPLPSGPRHSAARRLAEQTLPGHTAEVVSVGFETLADAPSWRIDLTNPAHTQTQV